jgi:hypothetical protein
VSVGKRIAAVLGAGLAVLGLVAVFAPGILGSLPTDRALVLVLGVVLVLGGVREINRRRTTEQLYAETPDAEEIAELPTPGDAFDERFGGLTRTRYRVTERNRIREELAELTEETLVRRQGRSPEGARAAMEAGTWTDDPFAAAMFSADTSRIGAVARVREFLGSTSAFHHRVERVAAELARLVDDPQGATPATTDTEAEADAGSTGGTDAELAAVFGGPDAGEGDDD